MILAGKILCLFLTIFFGLPWIGMLVRGQSIAAIQTGIVAAGIVGFVTLQWLL